MTFQWLSLCSRKVGKTFSPWDLKDKAPGCRISAVSGMGGKYFSAQGKKPNWFDFGCLFVASARTLPGWERVSWLLTHPAPERIYLLDVAVLLFGRGKKHHQRLLSAFYEDSCFRFFKAVTSLYERSELGMNLYTYLVFLQFCTWQKSYSYVKAEASVVKWVGNLACEDISLHPSGALSSTILNPPCLHFKLSWRRL